jgi:hypothetical protein
MANGYIELDAMSGGDKIDAETLTVASTTVLRERVQIAGEADTEIARVDDAPLGTAVFGLGVRRITDRSSIASLFTSQAINATPTAQSSNQDVDPYLKAILYVEVIRSSAPADKLIIRPQYSDDGGTTYYDAEDQTVELSDMTKIPTSVGYRFTMELPYLGRDFRLELEGVNTDATHTFTVTVTAEFIK